MKVNVENLSHLADLFCASRKQKCNVGDKLGLETIVTENAKCNGTFQDADSGTLRGMKDEVVQMDTIILLDDDLGDGSKQCTKSPIQQDVMLNDSAMVGVETCGDELVLGALQLEDNWLDGNETDVAPDGSQHLEMVIVEIVQLALGRNVLSKSVRR